MDVLFETDAFFAGRPQEWAIFEALRARIMEQWPQTQTQVMKTCVRFSDPKPFAYISHPPRKSMTGLLVTLSLRAPGPQERYFMVVPINSKRSTVHVLLKSPQEADDWVMEQIERARNER